MEMIHTGPKTTIAQWLNNINTGFSTGVDIPLGDLDDLETSDKSSLVAAINSININVMNTFFMDGGGAANNGNGHG